VASSMGVALVSQIHPDILLILIRYLVDATLTDKFSRHKNLDQPTINK